MRHQVVDLEKLDWSATTDAVAADNFEFGAIVEQLSSTVSGEICAAPVYSTAKKS